MPAIAKPAPKVKTLGALIDQLNAAREKKRRADEHAKILKAEFDALEQEVLERLQAEGTDKATGKVASASISRSTVANVENWDLYYEFIRKNKFFHLLQRRPADAACRELWELGKNIPGVVPFTKTTLNLRSL
jgi:hypothetical protein